MLIVLFFPPPGDPVFSPPFSLSRITAVSGVLREDPGLSRGNSSGFLLEKIICYTRDGGAGTAPGTLMAFVTDAPGGILAGDPIFLEGAVFPGEKGWLFQGRRGNPGTFPFVDLSEDRILPQLFTMNRKLWGDGSYRLLRGVRRRILLRILSPLDHLSRKSAGLVKALLLGIRDDLDPSLYEGFRRAGVLHILALSGMHLGILTGVLTLLFYTMMGKKGGFFAVLLFTVLYLFLTGLKISLLRAAVMFFLMGTARYLGREPRPLRALGGAFLIALLLDPASVATPGFQLSFGALAGILILGKPLAAAGGALLPFGPGRALGQGVGISLGAQLVTAPLLLFWFDEMVITGFLASLVVTPVVTVYLFAGLGYLLLSPFIDFPWKGYLSLLMEKGYSFLEEVVLLFYHSPSWSPRSKMVQYLLVVLVAALVYRHGRKGLGHYSVRLTRTDQSLHGSPGVGHDKEVRAEFSHKPRSPEETSRFVGSHGDRKGVGNRSRVGRHDTYDPASGKRTESL